MVGKNAPPYLRITLIVVGFANLCRPTVAQQAGPYGPQVLVAVAPVYPVLAAQTATQGGVRVQVILGADGHVEEAAVVQGHALLRDTATTCARKWSFEVGEQGRLVKLVFDFRIMPKGTPEPELAARFSPPYGVEVRRIVPEAMINSDPPPDRPKLRSSKKFSANLCMRAHTCLKPSGTEMFHAKR